MAEEEEEEEFVCRPSAITSKSTSRRRGSRFSAILTSLLVLCLLHSTGSIPFGKEKPRSVGSAEAWRPPASFPGFVFPEQMGDDAGGRRMLEGRYKSAVCFSGGGLRSFIASIGYLAALEDLGLMDEIGYTTGVSGGSWATVLYSYYKRCVVGRACCHRWRSLPHPHRPFPLHHPPSLPPADSFPTASRHISTSRHTTRTLTLTLTLTRC